MRKKLSSARKIWQFYQKTMNIIKETLMKIKFKAKFIGEISSEFLIDAGVLQEDALSLLLFNCALENVRREWRKARK